MNCVAAKSRRVLSRLGTIDMRQRVPQQLAEMMSLLAELVEIYRSAGGQKIIVYVRRMDDEGGGDDANAA